MSPKPDRSSYLEQSQRYYDRRFGSGDTELNDEERLRLGIVGGLLEPALGWVSPARPQILDFGCGRGWLSDFLSAHGEVTGVDLSGAAVQAAQQRYPRVNFLVHDITDRAIVQLLGEHRFDVVVSSEVVEHVLDQDAYFDNIFRLLKSSGAALILTTPNGRWKENFFHGERRSWGQPYEFWLTRRQIARKIRGQFRNCRLETFFSRWIEQLPSYGTPNLLGHCRVLRLVRALRAEEAYFRALDGRGFGLYISLLARR